MWWPAAAQARCTRSYMDTVAVVYKEEVEDDDDDEPRCGGDGGLG
jgi:hypothetical protein